MPEKDSNPRTANSGSGGSGGGTVTIKSKWFQRPQKHDYPAALEYLSLIFPRKEAIALVKKLEKKEVVYFYAKDIFRATALQALKEDNYHVKKNIQKMKDEKALSPILLVKHQNRIIVADGYHRLCAVYLFNEDIRIPCQLTST